MPYTIQYDVPGDAQLYARVKAAIGDDDPPGLQLHLVVTLPQGGLRHIEVWDAAGDQEEFARERVAPAVAGVLRSMGVDPVPTLPPRPLDLVDLHMAG